MCFKLIYELSEHNVVLTARAFGKFDLYKCGAYAVTRYNGHYIIDKVRIAQVMLAEIDGYPCGSYPIPDPTDYIRTYPVKNIKVKLTDHALSFKYRYELHRRDYLPVLIPAHKSLAA